MQKTACAAESGTIGKRIFLVMKLTGILLTVAFLQVHAGSIAQHVTFSGKNVPLEKVFASVKTQTGFSFFYDAELIRSLPAVSIQADQMPYEEFLAKLFEPYSLSFSVRKKNIIVFRKELPATQPARGQTDVVSPVHVTGRIADNKGLPIAAVSITAGNKKNGTTTDANGYFSMQAEEGDVLTVTNVAYLSISVRIIKTSSGAANAIVVSAEKQEEEGDNANSTSAVVVSPGQTLSLSFTLVPKIYAEQAITVSTSYYSTSKKLSTGNITKVTAKEIENQPVTSLLMALQGRVAGLEINPKIGTPGSAPIIHIRGINSLRGNDIYRDRTGNYPLYVIDGMPVNAAQVESISNSFMLYGFDPLSFINPQNIESIEVLKDGDATAIYGSRGANGVILVTTKQGKATGKTTFEVNAYRGMGKVTGKVKLLNTQQYLQLRREAFANDHVIPDANNAIDLKLWDTTRYTDWQKVLLGETANITDVNATITGGNAYTSFIAGGGYHKETMIFPGDSWYGSGTIHFSLNHSSLNRKFRSGLSFNYGATRNRLFDNSNFMNGLFLPPNAPAPYDEQGKLNWEVRPSGIESWQNPFAGLQNENTATSSNLVLNANMGYEILPGLTVKTSFGLTELHGNEFTKKPVSARSPGEVDASTRGSSTFGINQRKSWIIEPQVNYRKKWGEHSLDIVLGSTLQESKAVFQNISASGYTSDEFLESLQAAVTVKYFIDEDSKYRYTSAYTRIGYNYREKYVLNITGRRDGSSRFGPGKQFGNFGSLGAAWIFSDEPFARKYLKFLDFGKLRVSYGITGNDQIGDYKFYNLYNIGAPYNNTTVIYPDALFNPDFAWENTRKMEVALQLGFWQNRVMIDVSGYLNRSSNQLVSYPLPATTGFPFLLSNFNATVENYGLEAVINTSNINGPQFKWTTTFNITLPKNRLAKFDGIESSPYAQLYKVGEPLTIQYLYTWAGVHPQKGTHRFLDLNKDGVLNESDKRFMYSTDPRFYGGLINNLRYKNIELSFLLQFSSRFAASYLNTPIGTTSNQLVSVLNHWQKPGDIVAYEKPTQDYSSFKDWVLRSQSDYIVQDATFLRLKTLSLSYSIPKRVGDLLKMQEAKLYIQGQNLFTITQLENLDPETGSFLPPIKILTVGLQVKF